MVEAQVLEDALRSALCVAVPSSREGYGLLVVEGAALGCPSVVVDDRDNASTELVTEGVNGCVAPSADPAHLADALLRVFESGQELRRSTARWYAANAHELSLGASADRIRRIHERARNG